MGKKDTVTKDYIRRPKIFADAFNQFVYHGRQEILPELLTELDTAEIAAPYGDDGAGVPEQRYRDSLKLLTAMTDGSRAFCILGIESQADIHYAIPVKNGLYDFLQLAKQVSEAARTHRETVKSHGKTVAAAIPYGEAAEAYQVGIGDAETGYLEGAFQGNGAPKSGTPTSGEYLGGFWRTDRLLPVMTLVLYFGAEKWDGPLTLREMYDCRDEELLSHVADYHVNLLAPGNMTDDEIALFHTDLREVMQYIKYSRDKEKIAEILGKNGNFRHIDRGTAEVINTVTNSKLKFEEKEDSVDMCLALDQIREECRAEGRTAGIAEGRTAGITEGRTAGIAEGRTVGIAEGRARGMAELVLELLEELGEIPKEIRDRVEGEKDPDTLKKWHRDAARADSIADFVGQMI